LALPGPEVLPILPPARGFHLAAQAERFYDGTYNEMETGQGPRPFGEYHRRRAGHVKSTGGTAADAWALFARDADGAKIAAAEHKKLKAHGIWVWKEGTIEDALGLSDKGEEAIQAAEQTIATMSKADVKANYPSVADFFDWLTA
jgi:hypothetical protein